jgi:hypothetical protein
MLVIGIGIQQKESASYTYTHTHTHTHTHNQSILHGALVGAGSIWLPALVTQVLDLVTEVDLVTTLQSYTVYLSHFELKF